MFYNIETTELSSFKLKTNGNPSHAGFYFFSPLRTSIEKPFGQGHHNIYNNMFIYMLLYMYVITHLY